MRPATLVRRETDTCFIVRDGNGQALARRCDANGQALVPVYFEDEPGRRSAAKLLPATKRGLSPP